VERGVGGTTKALKLVIQIPCLNEQEQLPATIADLPRAIPGVDVIEVLVIDDGSTDATVSVAREHGVHHIVRLPRNRGLAAAHAAGLDAALRLGADIVVNTDADNQYQGADIAELVAPILAGRADLVIGDRDTSSIPHFSAVKRLLQRLGSRLVRRASGTEVRDSTSGFRAMNRRTIQTLFTHNRFTYTLESIIHAGSAGLVIENVRVRTNEQTRPSRLFSSIPQYLRRQGPVILRAYGLYWPVQSFGFVAVLFALPSLFLIGRFFFYYLADPDVSSHAQSLSIGVGGLVLAFVVGLLALLGDLLATNRRLSEEILQRVRRLDATVTQLRDDGASSSPDGVESTGAAPWGADGA
jgi:glycosyltransferase involved in cell wall biosynthesis